MLKTRMQATGAMVMSAMIFSGCGGLSNGKDLKTSAQTCTQSVQKLRKRLGPEMGQVVQSVAVKISPQDDPACAVVYTLLGEEMYGEGLPVAEVPDPAMDHRLALGTWHSDGKVDVSLIESSPASPGAVHLTLSSQDADKDGLVDLVVMEASSTPGNSWQGLRLFSFAQLDTPPHEMFTSPLMFKTPEGVELAGEWASGKVNGRPALMMSFGSQKRVYSWDAVNKQFTFDQLATNAQGGGEPPATGDAPAAAPKAPKAPETPASDLSKELGLD